MKVFENCCDGGTEFGMGLANKFKIFSNLDDAYCPHITIWNLCGWFGAAPENTGALERPAEDELTGIVGYKFRMS